MADEPKDQPEEIEGILSDLDAILSGIGDEALPAPGAPPPPETKPIPPAELPKAAEPPKPIEPKRIEPAKLDLPMPSEPAPVAEAMKIDLPPRADYMPPPAKKPEPPKPAAPPAPAPVPVPAPAAVPASAVSASAVQDIPASTPKDQIRRVAYVYTFACSEARANFAAYLAQAARTISKKPIYLRSVMSAELSAFSDPAAVFEKARDAKAVAVLAVVEGWPPAKIEGLSEACARGGLLFRTVAPGDVQKKSTAVDVIVDMMLLSGEA